MKKLEVRNEREWLVAQQAVLAYREVEAAGAAAAHGQGMAALERATLETGRRQMRQVLTEALRSQAEAQKKGRGGLAVPAAMSRCDSSVNRPKR
jgi:hypothetical protein